MNKNFLRDMKTFKITSDNFKVLNCDKCDCFLGYILIDIGGGGYFDAHICKDCHKKGWSLEE